MTTPSAFTVPIYINTNTTGPQRYIIYAGIGGGSNLPYLFDTGAPNLFSVFKTTDSSLTNGSFTFAQDPTYYYATNAVQITLGSQTSSVVTTGPVNYAQVNSIQNNSNSPPNPQNGSALNNGTYGDFGAGLYGSSTLATVLSQVPLPQGYKTGYLLDVTGNNSPQGSLLLGLSPSLITAMTNLPGAIVLPLSLTGTNIPASGTNSVPGANKPQFGNARIELSPSGFGTNLPIVFDTGGGPNAVIYADGIPANDTNLVVSAVANGLTNRLYSVTGTTPWGGNISINTNTAGGTRINSGGYFFQNYRMMLDLSDSLLVLAPLSSVITPQRVNLVPSLLSNSVGNLGGNPHFKYGIYASLAGSTTPQLYEVDTGGTGFYAAYASDPTYASYAPAWGTNLHTNNTTNGFFQYTSGNTYQGPSVNTSFTLYSSNALWSNNASGLTPVITSMTNILVGQTTNITNVKSGTELWPSTSPPIPGGFYGDFGLGLGWNPTNNIVNPLAQLFYGSDLIPGYVVHLGYQPTSTNYYSGGAGLNNTPYLQVGLTQAELAAYPYRFALLTNAPVNSFSNSGVNSYAEASFIASMTISNPSLGVTNISIPVILDTGATPEFHYTSNYAALANFFSVSSNAPGFLSIVVTNTDGVPVTLYQSELSTNGTNAINVGTTTTNVFGGYNYDFNIGEQLFYQYDVAFNLRDGIIAFNPLNGTNIGILALQGSTVISNNATYSSVSFETSCILTVAASGALTVGNNVVVSNNSTVNLNGIMTVSNTMAISQGSTLAGGGTLNANLANSGTVTMSGMTINGGVDNLGSVSGTGVVNGNFTNGTNGILLMSGMTINGNANNAGAMLVNGNGNSVSGTLQVGTTGATTVASGGSLAVNGAITDAGSLVNYGTITTPLLAITSGGSYLMQGATLNGSLNNGAGGYFFMDPSVVNGNVVNSGVMVVPDAGNIINGNLALTPGSVFEVAGGANLNVTGTTILGGTLVLSTAQPFGTKGTFLTSSGYSGAFSSIVVPAGERGRLLLEGNAANILYAPASYTQVAANPNQSNVATVLNGFITATGGDRLAVSTSLDSLTTGQYGQAFNAISPVFYQQMASIAFNQANAQNSELVQRLWGLRVAEGGGFSMSGLADNYAVLEGQGNGSKGVVDARNDILRPGEDNRWGMFVDGNGIFAQASSANMLPGYSSESGGVTTGLTYKWNKNLASGIYTGYQGSYTKSGAGGSGLGVGSSLIDNAVRFGAFGTWGQENGKGLYANALAGGAYHNFQATRIIQYTGLNRTANSAPGAGELDSQIAVGDDIQKDKVTFGPIASLQYTYLGVNDVNETGAQSLNFNSSGWSSSSMISSLGAHAAYTWIPNTDHKAIVVVPQISLNWQHEFLQNPYAINGNLGGTGPNFANWSEAPIRDFLYTGVGVTVEVGKRWNISLFYNAAAGNSDLVSQNIFWSAGVRF